MRNIESGLKQTGNGNMSIIVNFCFNPISIKIILALTIELEDKMQNVDRNIRRFE